MKKLFFLFTMFLITTSAAALTLSQAEDLALKNNERLLASNLDVQASHYKVLESLGSFLPVISGSYSYLRLNSVPKIVMSLPNPLTGKMSTKEIEMGKLNNYDVKFNMRQPLFMWGRIYNAYKISKIDYSNTDIDYKSKQRDIIYEVKTMFYNTLLAKEQVKLAKESLNRIQIHYKSVQKRFNIGLASNLDLIQVNVKKSDTRRLLISAQNAHRIALLNLKTLIGIPLDKDIKLTAKFRKADYSYNESSLKKKLLENDLELKKLKNKERLLQISKKIIRVGNLPALTGNLNYEYKYPYNSQDKFGSNTTFMLLLNANLFRGGNTLTRLRQNRLRQEALKRSISYYRKMLNLKLQSVLSELQADSKELDVSILQVRQASDAYAAAKERYENGLISNLDFLNTQLMLLHAKISRNVSIFKYNRQIFLLQKMTGSR